MTIAPFGWKNESAPDLDAENLELDRQQIGEYAEARVKIEEEARVAADALKAPIASPSFTGTPKTESTPAAKDNSLKVATTAYADRAKGEAEENIPYMVLTPAEGGEAGAQANSEALKAAFEALKEPGGRIVIKAIGSERRTFWVNETIEPPENVVLEAANQAIEIKAVAGFHTETAPGVFHVKPLVSSPNFNSLTLTGAHNMTPGESSGSCRSGLINVTLDHNYEHQKSTAEGAVYPTAMVQWYGSGYTLDKLIFRGGRANSALHTEFGQPSNAEAENTRQTIFGSLQFIGCERHGWHHLGPSDCQGAKVTIWSLNRGKYTCAIGVWADKDGFSNGSGTSLWTAAGFQMDSFHDYSIGEGGYALAPGQWTEKGITSWGIVADTQIFCSNIESEGSNVGQYLFRVGVVFNGGPGFYENGSTYCPGKGVQFGDLGVTPGLEAQEIKTAEHTTTLNVAAANGAYSIEPVSTTGISEGSLIQLGTQVIGVSAVNGQVLTLTAAVSGTKAQGETVTTGKAVSKSPNLAPCSVTGAYCGGTFEARMTGFMGDSVQRAAFDFVACTQLKASGLAATPYPEPSAVANSAMTGVDVSQWTSGKYGAMEVGGYTGKPHFSPTEGRFTVECEHEGSPVTVEVVYYGMSGYYESVETLRDCVAQGTVASGTTIKAGAKVTLPAGLWGSHLVEAGSYAFHKGIGSSSSYSILAGEHEGKTELLPHSATQDYLGLFGDGSDGATTLSNGGSAPEWATKNSNTEYTMTRDCFCTTLKIESGVTLNPAGFMIFGTVEIIGSGTIKGDGAAASGATAGTRLLGTTTAGSGATGGTGAGAAAGSIATEQWVFGSNQGGAGGVSGATAGGTGGAVENLKPQYLKKAEAILSGTLGMYGKARGLAGGSGGGAGAGDGTHAGGGGGAGANFIAISTPKLSGLTITARGGAGGEGVAGNAGGGGGGAGGMIAAYTLTTPTSITTHLEGGAGGAKAAGGTGEAGKEGHAGGYYSTTLV